MAIHKLSISFLVLMLFLSATSFSANSNDCYVIKLDGHKIKGRAITADDNGNITLTINDKMKMPFRYRKYRLAVIPKPDNVKRYEDLLEGEKYNDIIENYDKMMKHYKFVGWSYTIITTQTEALLKLNKLEEAKKVLRQASQYPGVELEKINNAMIRVYIADSNFDKAETILKQQISKGNEETAMNAFLLRGEMAEKRGLKKEAVLEYLKVLILFNDKNNSSLRDQAKNKAVILLTQLKDPRKDKIANYK
ncbi:MAG: hypothetical protein WCS73_10715 [Lentisphaeria bacterium]